MKKRILEEREDGAILIDMVKREAKGLIGRISYCITIIII